MTALQIIELILQLAPAGIQLTQEILALITALEGAFATGTPPTHQQAVVTALAAHLSK